MGANTQMYSHILDIYMYIYMHIYFTAIRILMRYSSQKRLDDMIRSAPFFAYHLRAHRCGSR
jgi:hypothetical protein